MFDQRLCIAYSALDRATALLGKEEKRFSQPRHAWRRLSDADHDVWDAEVGVTRRAQYSSTLLSSTHVYSWP